MRTWEIVMAATLYMTILQVSNLDLPARNLTFLCYICRYDWRDLIGRRQLLEFQAVEWPGFHKQPTFKAQKGKVSETYTNINYN